MRSTVYIAAVMGIVVILAFTAIGAISYLQKRSLQRERPDIVDLDFVATIKKTNDPLNFIIDVKKTNNTRDKKIGFFSPVVGLMPIDATGRELTQDINEVTEYAAVIDGFDQAGHTSDYLNGRVRLVRRELKAGKYRLKPYIRIVEVGKDAQRGPYSDGGSVLVKAGNSIEVDLKQPWEIKPWSDPDDVIDLDFTATITATRTPYVFLIEVSRIDPAVDKSINTHHEVFADFDLVDQKGRKFCGDFCIRTFSKDVSEELGPNDQQPYPSYRKGRVRLITTNLPPVTYKVRPNIRIVEEGKDRIENPRAAFSSVRVKAANSVSLTIK